MKTLLGEHLHFDWKIVTVIVVSTLLLIVDSYYQLTPNKDYDGIILYLIVPLIFIVLIFREDPRQYGFTFGDWKIGMILTTIGIAIMSIILWFVARNPAMQSYYKPQVNGLPWNTFLDFNWLGIFLSRLYFVCIRPQVWSGGVVAAGCAVCTGAYRQAGNRDALHDLWRLCLWLGCLPDALICLSVFDPLVHCIVYNCGRGRFIAWLTLRFVSQRKLILLPSRI